MARKSREHAQRTGEQIIASARAAFADRGFTQVGVEEVAADAGVTRGAVYHRYSSKQALFEAVLREVMSDVAEEVEAAADSAPADDPWGQIEAGCLAFVRAATGSAARQIMLIDGPAVLGWGAWRDLDAAHSRRTLEEGLAELDRAGLLRGDPEAVAILLSGGLNEAALWVAAAAAPEEALRRVEETLPALLAAFVPGGRASA